MFLLTFAHVGEQFDSEQENIVMWVFFGGVNIFSQLPLFHSLLFQQNLLHQKQSNQGGTMIEY